MSKTNILICYHIDLVKLGILGFALNCFSLHNLYILCAMACGFKQYGILTCVDSDQTVQLFLSLDTPNDVQPVA